MKWIYEINEDNTNRYVLGKIKEGKDTNPVICIGVNPSTATPDQLDNTIKSVQKLAENNGFDGWIMINLYPQRATDPNDLHSDRNYEIHIENLNKIEKIMKDYKPVIWAAWGTLIEKREYLPQCLNDIVNLSKKYDCKWITVGEITVKGHVRHPLFLKRDTKYDDFDIYKYVEKINKEKV